MMLMNLDSYKMARQAQPVMCTRQYVHCPQGYDPRDPCNHTCLEGDDSEDDEEDNMVRIPEQWLRMQNLSNKKAVYGSKYEY